MSKARELANLGNAYSDGALSNRNMVVNGSMIISQRNTSWSGLTSSQYTLDRFSTDIGGGGAIDVAQSTTAPDGFVNSMSLTVATADASIAAGDAYRISHQIEGQNVGHLNWGASSAQTVTLSFWVRSSVTGTYGLGISNSAETENYVAEYTINSANTWEKKTVTVAGRTSGTWLTTSGIGMGLRWDLGSGTNYNGTAGSWQTTGGKVYRTSSCVNWIATSGATFYLTGVQLEVGDTATPFEHRSYGDELAKCQRYYERLGSVGGYGNYAGFGVGSSNGASGNILVIMRTPKRVSPTFSYGGSLRLLSGSGVSSFAIASDTYIDKSGTGYINVNTISPSTGTGYALVLTANNDANAYFAFDAEL